MKWNRNSKNVLFAAAMCAICVAIIVNRTALTRLSHRHSADGQNYYQTLDSLKTDVRSLADTVVLYQDKAEQATRAALEASQKAEKYRREVAAYKNLANEISNRIKSSSPSALDSLWNARINSPAR